jgi:cell wall-associated NlpC family hydrolase
MGIILDAWLESLIGTAYDDEHECYWLVRQVAEHCLGLKLPENPMRWRDFADLLPPDAALKPFDVLLFDSTTNLGIIDHMGIVIDSANFMHSDRRCGQVVCEPIDRHLVQVKAVGRFKT